VGKEITGQLASPREITISGHGDSAQDICDSIRNADSAARNIKVRFSNNTDHTFYNVQPGQIIDTAGINRIYETDTTATIVEIFNLT